MLPLFNQCFGVMPDAVILVDGQGCIVQANARAREMFGYVGDADLVGVNVDSLVPERSRAHHQQLVAGFIARPRMRPMFASDHALVGRRQDGSDFPVEIALAPLQTEAGPCVLASIRDVSESMRARQVLLRARYDRLVARVGELVVMSSEQDAIVAQLPCEIADALPADAVAILLSKADGMKSLLRAECGLGGLPPAQLDAALAGLVSDDSPAHVDVAGEPQVITDLSAAVDSPGSLLLREAGFHSVLFVALAGREGPVGALIALSRKPGGFDKDSHFCLSTVANLLSGLIQRRRTEEQLAHSLRLDAIGRLTGGIAHDFNNMLTVVSGNLQLIRISCPDPVPIDDMLDSAQRAVDSASQLTAKLLTFARRQHLQPQWIDTSTMLGEMGVLLRRTLGETIDVDIDIPLELPALYADRGQLESALLNLALNARDAMPRGGQLRIEARSIELGVQEAERSDVEPGQFLCLTVVDTGLGMEPQTLERAFEPFFTTKSPSEGNGLGLSMVYGFVRQSGGHVRAESRLGYGTRIDLLLPLARGGVGAVRPVATEEAGSDADPGGDEDVLVVEDDQDVRRVTVAFLRSLGYHVDDVASAEEALDHVKHHSGVALVLSDVVLGSGKSGIELLQELEVLRPELPVLLTSGYEHETLQQLGISAGRFELLQKPYRRRQLALLLRRKLDAATD